MMPRVSRTSTQRRLCRATRAAVAAVWVAASLCGISGASAQPGGEVERIEADVSSRRIAIESDFAGIQVVVFGAVDNSRQRFAEQNFYDVAIVIRGPNEPTIVRKKDRVLGLWVNQAAQVFTDVPEFYAVLSTRPVDEIAPQDILERHHIGFAHLRFQRRREPQRAETGEEKAFREALIRLKQDQNLYQERAFAAAFTSRSLFRATVSVPANVPVGTFNVDIYLFHQGELLDTHQTELKIEKSGLERFVFNLAYEHSIIYGLAGVVIAIAAGLAASAAFRKT
jgi:uncharacterized protein (TIGR02186 family)